MSPIDIALSLAKASVSLIMLYILGVIVYSLYLFFNADMGRPSGWYWPDFINEWIGMPKTFSVAYSNIATGTDVIDIVANVSVNDCMSNCNQTTDCIGFVYNSTSNTCNTFSIISSVFPYGMDSSNVYIVDGNAPRGFLVQNSKGQVLSSNIASYTPTTPSPSLECATMCASNVTCTGFTMSGTSGSVCSQQTDPTFGTALIATTGTNSYLVGDMKLPSSDNGYIT